MPLCRLQKSYNLGQYADMIANGEIIGYFHIPYCLWHIGFGKNCKHFECVS